ncbi:MAG: helix-turn-helix domain-containing protein [Chitinophagaceae bacterium]|nr:MAG: helix-turn-helix domain-containing protein [Chitinophagaceae bacterium]
MGVSRQQVSKILRGNENLTFETVSKLENALNIRILSIKKQREPAAGKRR